MPRVPAAATPHEEASPAPRPKTRPEPMGLAIADAGIILLLLGLTFLLGIFPQHDTDFWWHLRTGDLIREHGRLPHTDWYTFGAEGHAWIDLHWGFQVALSYLYSLGGTDAANLAKCLVTTLAVGLLLSPRRRGWPVWVMALSWIPALLLLSGRMYVRPETLTLLYLSIDLAVLCRIDQNPRLLWIVALVQILWVNTQGLFVFGPIVLAMALIDACLRRGAFAKERRAWWRTVLAATFGTGLACLVNPYGLWGALYPLELARTMTSTVYSGIAELQSIPDFIARNGTTSLILRLHFLTLALGGMSFVVPIFWVAGVRASKRGEAPPARGTKRKGKKAAEAEESSWRLSPFRLMLYATFSALSFKATRNSHQFAAVVGAVTAWNFGEWAGAVRSRRSETNRRPRESAAALVPRFATAAALAAVILLVGTGRFYAMAGEGREIGWGERPLWFPHEAVKFASSKGMPAQFHTFHNGHAGLFEYHNGPDRKVFADARLEVMGPVVYAEYLQLSRAIALDNPGWSERLAPPGKPAPGVLVDHVQPTSTSQSAAFLGSPLWRCVWYDPIASVYLHTSTAHPSKSVDFAARHFGLDSQSDPQGVDALALASRTLMMQALALKSKGLKPRQSAAMIALGANYARRALAIDPFAPKVRRVLGQLHALSPSSSPKETSPAFRQPFDPLFDLANLRATHDLQEAIRLDPDDFVAMTFLFESYHIREMFEAASAVADRMLSIAATPEHLAILDELKPKIARAKAAVSKPANLSWSNLAQLDQVIRGLLDEGRVQTALDLMEKSFPAAERTWEQSDRMATLALHLGRPDRAREFWRGASDVPRPALREARVAVTHLVQGDFDEARKHFRAAIASEPNLFEAHYGLAALEKDAGRAAAALAAAEKAASSAASDVARTAAREIAEFASPYVKSP